MWDHRRTIVQAAVGVAKAHEGKSDGVAFFFSLQAIPGRFRDYCSLAKVIVAIDGLVGHPVYRVDESAAMPGSEGRQLLKDQAAPSATQKE